MALHLLCVLFSGEAAIAGRPQRQLWEQGRPISNEAANAVKAASISLSPHSRLAFFEHHKSIG
jgi:hypothetical protein